jgi:hypothetical protein
LTAKQRNAKPERRAPWPRFISKYALHRGFPIHIVVQATNPVGPMGAMTVYWVFVRTHHGWRWTLFSRNGRIIGAATEDFSSKYKSVRNAAFHGCPLWCRRRPWPNGMYRDEVAPSWKWQWQQGLKRTAMRYGFLTCVAAR